MPDGLHLLSDGIPVLYYLTACMYILPDGIHGVSLACMYCLKACMYYLMACIYCLMEYMSILPDGASTYCLMEYMECLMACMHVLPEGLHVPIT